MAVLGFTGICGVLRSSSTSMTSAVQMLPAILAISALDPLLDGATTRDIGRLLHRG
jgi:hypothetical protein